MKILTLDLRSSVRAALCSPYLKALGIPVNWSLLYVEWLLRAWPWQWVRANEYKCQSFLSMVLRRGQEAQGGRIPEWIF